MTSKAEQKSDLQWNPMVNRNGFGNLIKKMNHIGIVVTDVNRSLAFYTEVMGFQQIRRPTFNRHGAWLTMGNVGLHLMKGIPVTPQSDNLIIPHISLETESLQDFRKMLDNMKIPFIMVPDGSSGSVADQVVQYFIRDPDGYVIEVCNCDILTDFCMETDQQSQTYKQLAKQLNLSYVFKLAFVALKVLHEGEIYSKVAVPPMSQWADEADQTKLSNLLSRCRVYGDFLQGETYETVEMTLKQANNQVPLASKLIRTRKNGKEYFQPPSFYLQGTFKYQPQGYHIPTVINNNDCSCNPLTTKPSPVQTDDDVHSISMNIDIAKLTFDHFDKDCDGIISCAEVAIILRSLRQNTESETIAKIFQNLGIDSKKGIDYIDFERLLDKGYSKEDSVELNVFFNLLDMNGDGEVKCSEMTQVLNELGFYMLDEDIENIFEEIDEDGNGSLSKREILNYFSNLYIFVRK